MSFLKKLFGMGGEGAAKAGKFVAEVEHEGYLIQTAPMRDGSIYRVCGTISKEIDGEMKSHTLIRADTLPSADEASDMTVRKAKQMIKEQGDRLFR